MAKELPRLTTAGMERISICIGLQQGGIVEGEKGEPVDVYCQNLASQIQGNDNTAALAGQQNQPGE